MSTFTLPHRQSIKAYAPGAALMGMYSGYQDRNKKDPSFKDLTIDSLHIMPMWFTTNLLTAAMSGIKMTPRMLGSNVAASTLGAPILMSSHIAGYYAGKKFSDLFGKKTYDRKQQHNSGTAQKIY